MDLWLDQYYFDLEAIIDAISRTTAIKSPNLNYVDGILKNRLKQVEELQKEAEDPENIEIHREREVDFEKRQQILELIEFPRKSLRKDEMEDLDSLSQDFDYSDVEVSYRFLKKNKKDTSLASILRLLNGEEVQAERKKKITLAQVRIAEERSRKSGQTYTGKAVGKKDAKVETANASKANPMEERFNKRRKEKLDGK